jgi:hypothetical protein
VIYVDVDATGPVHDGTTWCQAYTNLSEAIDVAQGDDTIRVAEGTYRPDSSGLEDPRDASFALRDSVRIEGGYAGCGAPDPDLRDLELYESILDGDLERNDISPIESDCFVFHEPLGCDNAACEAIVCELEPECCESPRPDPKWYPYCVTTAKRHCCAQFGQRCDNTYHVVTAMATNDTAALDGLVVTRGYASGEAGAGDAYGGGIMIEDADPIVTECTIIGNSSLEYGGGVGVNGGSPVFQSCSIIENTSEFLGGGVYATLADPVFTDSTISYNESSSRGGGMGFDFQVYPTVSGCRLSGNTAGAGAAISTSSTVLPVTDTIMSDNSGGGAAVEASFSTLFVRNCAIIGNGTHDVTSSVGGMDIWFTDATIVSSLIAGNAGWYVGGVSTGESTVRFSQCSIVSNVAVNSVRGAGVEAMNATLAVQNSILWGNVGSGSMYLATQLDLSGSSALTMAYTDIYQWNTHLGGVGNFSGDPLFVDPLGTDGVSGTEDDDFRLLPGSPCINAGDPAIVPTQGETDLDGDPRLQGCRVDLGAYETDTEQLLGDFNADGNIDLRDVAYFQNCFHAGIQNPDWLEACLCVFDFNEDSVIDAADYPGFWTVLTTP